MLLALEAEAAKESGFNIIEKYGLLATPAYYEAFVNNCHRSHLKTCINHCGSFADSVYKWVLAEFRFRNSWPEKQNRARRTNSLCF